MASTHDRNYLEDFNPCALSNYGSCGGWNARPAIVAQHMEHRLVSKQVNHPKFVRAAAADIISGDA